MKCLGSAEGAVAWLEPYSTAEHFGPDGRLLPPEEIPEDPEYTHAWIKDKLEGDFDGFDVVFVKDMAYGVADKFEFLPKDYRHSFLIRHPLKAFMSYYRLLRKTMSEEEADASLRGWLPKQGFGYGELAELADYVEKELGESPVIVDADDVLAQPEATLRKYCRTLGLPFSKSLLSWEPGMPRNWIFPKVLWEAEKSYNWFTTVLGSRGFKKGLSQPISPEEVPPVVQELLEVSQPFYDKLHARRILPSS